MTYGYDVVARIGWLRQERRAAYAEIQATLAGQVQISESHIRHLYQQVYLPLLACHERQHWAQLAHSARQHGGLIIGLDGLAPEGGEPQLWFIRELLTGLTLRSGWLSRFNQATFEAFLQPLAALAWPIQAVLSDKQKGLPEAVATVLPAATSPVLPGPLSQKPGRTAGGGRLGLQCGAAQGGAGRSGTPDPGRKRLGPHPISRARHRGGRYPHGDRPPTRLAAAGRASARSVPG